jgi:hypothetical protein
MPSSSTVIEVDSLSSGGYDRIVVNGNANLNGALTVVWPFEWLPI